MQQHVNGTISEANAAINLFCIHLFNCSALAGIVWARISSWRGPLLSRGGRESARAGLSGRGSSGAGLGLNAPLRFGVLMENCASAGPNCSNSGSERGLGPQPGWEREKRREKDSDERSRKRERRCQLMLRRNLPKLMQKETGNNKKLDRVRQSTGMHFWLFSVLFRTGERNRNLFKAEDRVVFVVNCTVTCGDYRLAVPRNRATQVTAQVLLRLGEEWTV